jgi:protein-disulfide isomerase
VIRSNTARILYSFTFILGMSFSVRAQQTLARVNGDTITTAELEQKEAKQLLQARYQYYQAEKRGLDELVDQHLLDTEARKQGITVDQLLQREINNKVQDPTEEQLQVFYEGLDQKEPYDKVREKILNRIRDLRKSKLRAAYMEGLRSKANIVIELAPPMADVAIDDGAIEGRRDAPVLLVEFADYECPYCQRVNEDLIKLAQEYNGKLAVAYKDFPLVNHPYAEKAAEAARCAGEQGKFWEYHDRLFQDKKLNVPQLKEQAKALNLDSLKFDQCLDSGAETANVKKDREEGVNLGLSGTPSFFINGHFFSGVPEYATLRQMVEQQLATSLSSAKTASESSRR